ncbi:hypothetical protein W911_14335 [Hyphomicrobium nitrativorans NL23]|uniref:Uncharacterized protein n=1 Tax=Hyphomicrobium nitrativorans NL23 TaxID=1029756 RepID=V5SK42_9HYPH|nr:hypothetical protein [Hyphomicrobium nitrativorans]AHB50324.1 hypothetical protein W911_14335 [Hyphomicrobium nitrativorans NL23]
MARFPSFSFPSQTTQASGAFMPAQIDFSKISQIADSYYDGQTNRMKQDAFRDEQSARQDARARDAQVRQVFAGGVPKDAQGNLDYTAISERLMSLDPSQGVDFLKLGSAERERADSRAHRDRSFEADQSHRNRMYGLQQEQLTPSSVREYQFYAQNERGAGREPMPFNEWRSQSASGGGKYSLNPIYGVAADGKPVMMQLGSDGTLRQADTPSGVQVLGPGETAEARARGAATGKVRGQAQAELPAVVQNATQMLGMLNSLKSDPYLPRMLGPIDSRTPDMSSAAGRVLSKMNQINGAAFLTAFESLKGGGQITEIEGLKATQAISRLTERNMQPEEYAAAIEELEQVVRNGVIRARVDAGELPQSALGTLRNFEDTVRTPNNAQLQAPSVGTVMDGYRFKGGNPADQSNWEPI